jgi:hypothetical protein
MCGMREKRKSVASVEVQLYPFDDSSRTNVV